MPEAFFAMPLHECLPVSYWWNHTVVLSAGSVTCCTSHVDTSLEQLHTVVAKQETAAVTRVMLRTDWVAGEGAAAGGKGFTGASGVRRALAWYPEGDLDTNLTIVITNVGADFTRLGSFGDAEQFGGTLVAQMDRSYLNRSWNKPKTPVQNELWPQLPSRVQLMTLGTPGCSPSLCVSYANHAAQEARLLDAKARNNMYFIEYTVKKPSQEQKHLLSAVALGFNGRYNRLYTVTGQCKESELSEYKGTLQSVLQSFAPPALPPY
ncbi:TPA: hypothetical protein ACH3X1_005248 [Trebouxia sp. C0004]